MGKTVPSWQTFIGCNGGSLIIRHLKSGRAAQEQPGHSAVSGLLQDAWVQWGGCGSESLFQRFACPALSGLPGG